MFWLVDSIFSSVAFANSIFQVTLMFHIFVNFVYKTETPLLKLGPATLELSLLIATSRFNVNIYVRDFTASAQPQHSSYKKWRRRVRRDATWSCCQARAPSKQASSAIPRGEYSGGRESRHGNSDLALSCALISWVLAWLLSLTVMSFGLDSFVLHRGIILFTRLGSH